MELSELEIQRYQKQLKLGEVGLIGQQKLKASRVLVIGAGGLGCPVLLYLSSSGIGEICIVDGDTIELSNLQRQILYSGEDIGKKKAETATKAVTRLNPYTNVTCYANFLSPDLALQIIPQYDIVVDCTDNFGTRYLINDVCVLYNKPFVSAAIYKHEGQIGTFNAKINNEYSCNYRDLYPQNPDSNSIPNCNEIGVTAVLPGIIGLYQANEVIKYFINREECLTNKLLVINTWKLNHFFLSFGKSDSGNYHISAEIIKQNSYSIPCATSYEYNTIDFEEIENFRQNNLNFVVVDVREENEEPQVAFADYNIPLSVLEERLAELENFEEILFFCKSGKRSAAACQLTKQKYPHKPIHNLKGGVTALQTH